jgi:hypothetical protein
VHVLENYSNYKILHFSEKVKNDQLMIGFNKAIEVSPNAQLLRYAYVSLMVSSPNAQIACCTRVSLCRPYYPVNARPYTSIV